MKKGIGPRALGSPLKQTEKPKTKTKKKKMEPAEVAKEIIPGLNALVRVGDVAKRLKDLPKNATSKKNK
jgi:hypothetical protein